MTIIYLIGLYVFVVFLLSRLVIPLMGFRMYKIPKELPEEMLVKVKGLEGQSQTAEEFLKKTYDFVQSRWHAERLKTVVKFPLIFRTDLEQLWQAPGYAHCTTINYIFVCMLANSKFFTAENLKVRHVFFNGVPHQYVKVRLNGRWLDLDPSLSYVIGIPFGQRTRKWFG